MKKPKEHYVNNVDFCTAMVEYKDELNSTGVRPIVSAYLGECFLKIARKLSNKPNFINYPFKADMISDGVENCLRYMHNFDPEKTRNPFSYFTQIIYYAFLRRIAAEKKEVYIKYKYTEEMDVMGNLSDAQDHDTADHSSTKKGNEYSADYRNNFVETFEDKKAKKRRSAKQVPVDVILKRLNY